MNVLSEDILTTQLAKAKTLANELTLPPEIEGLTLEVGADAMGEASLWLKLHVRQGLEASDDEIKRLTQFARGAQAKLIDGGITLFPYTSLEQAA